MATENIFWSATEGSNWSVVGAASFHLAIASDDADTSYGAAGSANPNQSVTGLDMINPADSVSKITFVHKSKNTSAGGQKIRDRFVLNSTTTMNGTNITPATSHTVYTTDYPTNGDTAAAWTVAEIEGVGSSGIQQGAFVSNSWTAGEARTTYGYVTVTYTYNEAPVAEISEPDNNEIFIVGESITFTGTGTDTEDGDVTASAVWTSSVDGEIGTGGTFDIDTLSRGYHTITMEVTDSGSKTGTDSIMITVGPVGGNKLTLLGVN